MSTKSIPKAKNSDQKKITSPEETKEKISSMGEDGISHGNFLKEKVSIRSFDSRKQENSMYFDAPFFKKDSKSIRNNVLFERFYLNGWSRKFAYKPASSSTLIQLNAIKQKFSKAMRSFIRQNWVLENPMIVFLDSSKRAREIAGFEPGDRKSLSNDKKFVHLNFDPESTVAPYINGLSLFTDFYKTDSDSGNSLSGVDSFISFYFWYKESFPEECLPEMPKSAQQAIRKAAEFLDSRLDDQKKMLEYKLVDIFLQILNPAKIQALKDFFPGFEISEQDKNYLHAIFKQVCGDTELNSFLFLGQDNFDFLAAFRQNKNLFVSLPKNHFAKHLVIEFIMRQLIIGKQKETLQAFFFGDLVHLAPRFDIRAVLHFDCIDTSQAEEFFTQKHPEEIEHVQIYDAGKNGLCFSSLVAGRESLKKFAKIPDKEMLDIALASSLYEPNEIEAKFKIHSGKKTYHYEPWSHAELIRLATDHIAFE